MSFGPGCSVSEDQSITAISSCINAVRAWMIKDKMKLNNDSRAEFLIIGTQQQISKVRIDRLSVGDSVVRSVATARHLGVLFDKKLF